VIALSLFLTLPGFMWSGSIDIDIRQRMGFAPLYVKVQVRVERNEENRELCVEGKIDGSDIIPYSRCFEMQGAAEPIYREVIFKRVDAGAYEFYAKVRRPLETKYSNRIPVRVLTPGEGVE
jgi:hypothetical protein